MPQSAAPEPCFPLTPLEGRGRYMSFSGRANYVGMAISLYQGCFILEASAGDLIITRLHFKDLLLYTLWIIDL